MKDTELQAERKAFEAWWPDPLYDGHGLYRAPAQYAWAGWKARAAIEADRAQRVPDGLTLAVIGHKHFGNPIPQAWYAAAKELLASTPAPAQQEPNWWRKRADEIELAVARSGSTDAMRCYTDMRTLLQEVARHQEPPQQERKPMTEEQDRALCEAFCNAASDEYFKARPQLDSDVNRRIFYAGHRKAWLEWQAAHGIKE